MTNVKPSTASYETIIVRREGAVAIVELNRPDTLNAVNVKLAQELRHELELIAADRNVGSVVLTGAGRAFSSGFDLKGGGVPLLASGRPDTGWGLRNAFHPVVLALREMPQPVVAAVNGPAAGIGCSYALACDIVVAVRSAYFLLAFRNVGLVPDGGATVLVPARAGLGRALEMALLAEKVSAAEAHAWGLVNQVAEDDALMPTAMVIAERLATGPPEAQADIKRILNAATLDQLKTALEREAETQSRRSASDEAAEAILAFLQKRQPRYRD
jgi:2-(1,2-epoxy-1,2-dihydrophenyl)acetyl-CoA isomerase